jgi:hypothetical protein
MSQLAEVYTGLRIPIIRCLEIICPAWANSVFICNGFRDQVLRTEDGRTLVFTAVNFDIQLAKKNNKGNQTLAFALDNTTGEVQRKVDQALAADQEVTVIYRTYLSNNLLAPAETAYFLTVQGGTLQGNVATLQCGYFDLIAISWPRNLYNLNDYHALAYLT